MSATIEFACPHCSREIRTSARYAGMQGQCPHCGKAVKVDAPAGAEMAVMAAPRAYTGATDANPIYAGLVGAGATVVLYIVFMLVRETYIGQLFTQRGPVQFISTLVACWGLALLAFKYVLVRKQLSFVGRELELLPLERGVQITPKNVDKFLHHLESVPADARDSIVVRRMHGALEHFRARTDVPEVQAYLASQATIDASAVDSGYTLLRCFIWVIPILGFIGTVTGISEAVTNLAASLKSGDSAQVAPATPGGAPVPAAGGERPNLGAKMIEAMGGVTQGLATAFDTTFVGLVFAALLLFPTESLKRIEYGMLDRIESFTNESLLRRFADDEPTEALSPELARVLEPAFRKHQQWLVEWQAKVSELGSVIGRDLEKHALAIQERLQSVQTAKLDEAREVLGALASSWGNNTAAIAELKQAATEIAGDLRATVASATDLQRHVGENTAVLSQVAEQWRSLQAPQASNGHDKLEIAVEKLARAAEQLSQMTASELPVPLGATGASAPRGWRWFR
jgi:biopolymer transport protein ExbB/TolQ